MLQKDIEAYGAKTAIIREVITLKSCKIKVMHPKGTDVFHYSDTSERREQFRSATVFANQLKKQGVVAVVIDDTTTAGF